MAILKAINAKDAGRENFIKMLDYISNPAKISDEDLSQAISDFELDTFVNRFLHGQQKRKRQFKQFVISLEAEWSQDRKRQKSLIKKIHLVLCSLERFFSDLGYLSKGAIHMNTAHPHFHLLVETCNALTGKQFSQSPSDLIALKLYASEQLVTNGLEEVIRIAEITEEELLSEEDAEAIFDRNDSDDDWDGNIFDDITDWNDGTLEHDEEINFDKSSKMKTMCVIVEPHQKHEMCRIVLDDKHEMCRIVHDDRRIMCKIVTHKKIEGGN